MPAQNVVDSLYAVAGLDIIQHQQNSYFVGMRGFNDVYNNRVAVLVDGRNFLEAWDHAYTPWSLLPLHLRDIERIEVVRGPGSTLYGANAFSGVISIQGKRPLSDASFEADIRHGALLFPDMPDQVSETDPWYHDELPGAVFEQEGSGFAAYNWHNASKNVGIRVSGFAGQPAELRDVASDSKRRHGEYRYGLRLALDYEPGDKTHAELDLTTTAQEMPFYWADDTSFVRREQALRGSLEHQGLFWDDLSLTLQLDWRYLNEEIYYQDKQGTPEAYRYHLLAQADLPTMEGRNLLTAALDFATDVGRRADGQPDQAIYMALALQDELALAEDRRWLLNAGLRLGYVGIFTLGVEGVTNSLTYLTASPRAAIIFRPQEQTDYRVSVATSLRTPSPYQSLTGQRVTVADPASGIPRAPVVLPRTDLNKEKALSLEFGYRDLLVEQVLVEATLFAQRLSDLTEFVTEDDGVRVDPYYFENRAPFWQAGAELSLEYRPFRWLECYLHYTFTGSVGDQLEAVQPTEDLWFPERIVGAGVHATLLEAIQLGGSLYNATEAVRPRGAQISPDDAQDQLTTRSKLMLDLRAGYTMLDGQVELYLAARNLLAIASAPDRLVQEPYSGSPIGSSIWIGLSLQPQ